MSDEQRPQGGFVGFLATIPGILTAVAAVLTAVGGIYLGLHKDGPSPPPPPTQAAMTVNLRIVGGTPPAPAASVDEQSLRLGNSPVLSSTDPVEQLIDRCGHGDEGACTQILDTLTQDCSDGYGLSCDVLYEISPIGSAYEAFGATCGGRFTEDYADTCSEQ